MSALQQGGASASPTFAPVAFAVWASDPTISRAQFEALDDLYHNADLIGRLPMPCEISRALGMVR